MNKYQTGNKILPTAQYASIKYDRGTKHIYPNFVWDSKLDPKKDIRGVRANNPLHSEPGEIMREILYSPSTNQPVDTIYREYPTALLPVKIQTRVASSNDQDRKEYETLKRRFNTAWNVSRPYIRYGIFKEGGMITKYQYGGPLNRYFRAGNDGYYYGIKSGKKYTAQDAARWLTQNHIGNYNAQSFTREFDRQNPQQSSSNLFSTIGKGLSGYLQDIFTYRGNGNALMKFTSLGQLYLLGKNMYEASQQEEQPQQQQYIQQKAQTTRTSRPNTGFSTDRFDFEEHPMEAARKRYNGSPVTSNAQVKPPVQTPPTDEEFDLSENNPLVQKFLKDNGYTKASIETPEYQNGMHYVYNNGKFEETETSIKPEAPTYESLVQANTTAFNNGMNSASWRRNFRKSFNNALLNGDMYGINPNGSQVFDINGMNVSEMIQNIGGLDPRKGLTRRGMRLLKKQQKAYNGNIFENVNTKVRTLPFQEISNQELDSLGQDALPQFQVYNHGLDVPFMNPTYEESDEGDIVNIGTKNIPFYQEVKRQ